MPEISNTVTSRRRPLSTCGASTLIFAHVVYKMTPEITGPIGAMTKPVAKLSSAMSPMVSVALYNWLAVLAFVDDHILAIENIVETHFPASSRIFDTIDVMVNKVEDCPNKCEDLINKIPWMIHKIPFLDSMVVYTIKWLEFITSLLVGWGLNITKEKEIRVDDIILNDQNLNKFSSKESNPSTYEEALESDLKEKYDHDEKVDAKDIGAKDYKKDKDVGNWIEETKGAQMAGFIATNEDPLLELFEFGWEAPKPKTSALSLMSRSNSQMSRSSSQMLLSNSQT